MAENLPTPTSPPDLLSNHQRRTSALNDSDTNSDSDIIEETPEEHLYRLFKEHEREFKHKMRALVVQAEIMTADHTKSIKQLKHVFKQYIGNKRDHVQSPANLDRKRQSHRHFDEFIQAKDAVVPTLPPAIAENSEPEQLPTLEELPQLSGGALRGTRALHAYVESVSETSHLGDVDECQSLRHFDEFIQAKDAVVPTLPPAIAKNSEPDQLPTLEELPQLSGGALRGTRALHAYVESVSETNHLGDVDECQSLRHSGEFLQDDDAAVPTAPAASAAAAERHKPEITPNFEGPRQSSRAASVNTRNLRPHVEPVSATSHLHEIKGLNSISRSVDVESSDQSMDSDLGDEDAYEDIVYEELPEYGSDVDPPRPVQPTLGTSLLTPLPKPQKERKSTNGGRAPQVRWGKEEEDRMIEIIYQLSQKTDDEGSRSNMWKRAADMHQAFGYNRSFGQMAAKWSQGTRDKCEERGLTWARDVMKKTPHAKRGKRGRSSAGNQSQDDSPTKRKTKRAKKLSKKIREAPAPSSSLSRVPHQPLGPRSDLQLRYSFTGASGALVQVDWSPDGQYFVAASSSIVGNDDDDNDVRKNRPCNLMFGSLSTKTIRELPEHREEGKPGQPQYIYRTVSAVKFAKHGHNLYTGGYDNKLKIWDVENEARIKCETEMKYNPGYNRKGRIEVMDVAGDRTTILATGTSNGAKSVRVFINDDPLLPAEGTQEIRPLQKLGLRSFEYSPTCLKFGNGQSRNRLIAGFGEENDEEDGSFGSGCMGMWQFTESDCVPMPFEQEEDFVSDCSWSAEGGFFVVGAIYDRSKPMSSERSVVKLYSLTEQKSRMHFNCPARDINDVTIASRMVTASCTDGSTYVWDQRNPTKPLHILAHGKPLQWFRSQYDREIKDVGVRYVEWVGTAGQIYTGSSDGVLKLWDTRRSQADVLLQDVAEVGTEILAGKLSPDQSTLLIGDEDARIHLFDRSKTERAQDEYKFMVAEYYA